MLQRSFWSGLILSAAVAASISVGMNRASAQAEPAGAPSNFALADNVLHYSLVNRPDQVTSNADQLMARNLSSADLLKTFESAAETYPNSDFRAVLLQDLHRPDAAMVASVTKILDKVDEGYRNVSRDPVRIRADLNELTGDPRHYQFAKEHLTAAGQFAVPLYLEHLQRSDPGLTAKENQTIDQNIVRIMGEIGRPILTPLIEELQVADPTLRTQLVGVIAQIGYPQALPALRKMALDPATPGTLKAEVEKAIARIDHTGRAASMSPAELYVAGGENYYNGNASYLPPLPDEKTNPVWYFDASLNNVTDKMVPTEIWPYVMAMRQAEAALKLEPDNTAAISLWLAANLKREIMLPAGATDPTRPPGAMDAAFYAHASGPTFMNPVLSRALDAGDSALALRAIDSLASTGGVTGLVSGEDSPLVRALKNPDREVRYQAAFALAGADPTSQFPSFYQVVPTLAAAVTNNSNPAVLLVVKDDDIRNALTDALRNSDAHYTVYAGGSLSAALAQAQNAPAMDAIIVPADADANGNIVSDVKKIGRTDFRFTGVPILVAGKTKELDQLKLRYAEEKGVGVIDDHSDAASISTGLNAVRGALGVQATSADLATKDSLTALAKLDRLAADHHSIYSITDAIPALVHALKDARPEVVAAAASVQGKLNSPECQRALAISALSASDAGVQAMLLHNLAESAKHTGDTLDGSQVNDIIKIVLSADADAKARAAAAEALGALNIPSNQASTLILQQSK